MSNLNKSKTILVTLLTCAAFSAHASWWDNAGDDGNPNTIGNTAAKPTQNMLTANNDILIVGLVNNTTKGLSSVVLKDKTGKVLYSSAKGKTCAVGGVCRLRVPRNLVTQGSKNSTFFFYDQNNKLVSAYMIANGIPQKSAAFNIIVDMDSLGAYVLSKIQVTNPKITYNIINEDIVTTTLSASPYEELADYYLDLLGKSQDNTPQETKIIKNLANQFVQNKTIPANPSSKRLMATQSLAVKSTKTATNSMPTVKAASGAEGLFCSGAFKAGMDVVGKLGLPGGIVSGLAKGITGAACPADNKLADQFAKIDAEFGKIAQEFNKTYDKLNALGQTVTFYALYDQKQTIDAYDLKMSNWIRTYSNALAIYKGADGQEYNTLKGLIDSYGGVDNAIQQNPGLANDLVNLYQNNEVRTAIQNLGQGILVNTQTQLRDLCSNSSSIVNGVISIRNWCNLTAFDIYTKNILLANQTQYVYNDVNQVFNADTRKDKQLGWKTITEIDFTALNNKIDSNFNPEKAINPTINETDPVYTLVNNLKNEGFTIDEWYSESRKRYITTSYDLNGTVIKAKYAYQHPDAEKRNANGQKGGSIVYDDAAEVDSNIVNVMGVPVPKRFFTGEGKSQNNYGANEAFPWTDRTLIAGAEVRGKWSSFATADFKTAAGKLVVHAAGFKPGALDGTQISSDNGWTSQENYEGSYERQVFAYMAPDSFRVKYFVARENYVISDGEMFTFMRYTANSGYSYVWATRTWVKIYDDAAQTRPIYAAPQCMTNDCLAINTGKKMDLIKFNDGLGITWNYEGPETNREFTLQETK